MLCSAAAAPAQTRVGSVDITIAALTTNAVSVDERFVLEPSRAPLELRILTRPCLAIENIRVERNGDSLALVESRSGPWISVRDTTLPGGDSIRLTVRYNVWLGGSRTIPLAHLTSPLERSDSAVRVAVRFARDGGEVEFPHMSRQAPNEWSGRFVATPAFVTVGGIALACDRRPPPGDNGGLVWRFWLLVGIMVAWVPLYLAWARRTGEAA